MSGHCRRRRWRAVGSVALGAATAAIWLAASAATAQEVNSTFMIDPPAPPADEAKAAVGTPLLTTPVWAQDAVRLSEPVKVSVINPLRIAHDVTLPAGTVLAGSRDWPGVYCAPLTTAKGTYPLAPCLVDADNDGKFEATLTLRIMDGPADGIGPRDDGMLVGVHHGGVRPLPGKVAYAKTDYHDGFRSTVDLMWQSNFRPNKPDRPVELELLFYRARDNRPLNGAIWATPRRVILTPGASVLIDVYGSRIRILGFEPDGALRYRFEKPMPVQSIQFLNTPRPITVYLSH